MARRADRLFQIIQILRRGRLVTARGLAGELEVSERTIYRDIRDLILSGVPIEGEAGVGYIMKKGFDLPPLMFDREELEALLVGTRMLAGWADPLLARASDRAYQKILQVLPGDRLGKWQEIPVFVPALEPYPVEKLTPLRQAITEARKIRLAYTRADGDRTRRVIRPLGLFYWGGRWTVVGWCELRSGFRQFRIDRIEEMAVLEDRFDIDPGRTLADFLEQVVHEEVQPRVRGAEGEP